MSIAEFLSHYWLFILLYQAVFAFASSSAARHKNRDQGVWFILGLVFGIFALVAVFIIKSLPDELAPGNNLLLDSDQYLRAGWRVLLFLLAVLALYYASAIIAKLTGVVPQQSFFFLFYLDVILATYLMTRFIDRRRFTSVGIPYHGRIVKEVLLGILVGMVMIGLIGGFELVAGAIRLHIRPGQNVAIILRNFGLSFLFFAFFAMGEELIFRGYPFQALIEGTGAVVAAILMSVAYGLVHHPNPFTNPLLTFNTMLAGAWLCIAYLKTRTLYFPFGMHFSWNFVQSFFLSLPVSGLLTNRTIFVPTDYGPYWLTGGRYGPEAGAGATVVMIAAIVYFLVEKRIKPSYDFEASKERVVIRRGRLRA